MKIEDSELAILTRVVAPLSRGPLFTVAFLDLSFSWNSLQWPLVVAQTPTWRPVSVGLARLITEAGPQIQLRMAGAFISLSPVLILFLAAQRQIVESVSATGLKD